MQIHSVVSKMMVEEGLAASWDQPTCSIVMRNAQPSRLQSLASDLSDKTAGAFLPQVPLASPYIAVKRDTGKAKHVLVLQAWWTSMKGHCSCVRGRPGTRKT